MRWHYTKPKRSGKKISEPDFLFFSIKEIIWIIIAIILASFISFMPEIPNDNPIKIISTLLIFSVIILTNISAKKLMSPKRSIRIEHSVWEFQRWGWYKRSQIKKPIPMGLIFSFFLAFFSLGIIKPFLFLQFNAEDIPQRRILKSQGNRRAQRKEGMNEEDLGYTALVGFYSLLFLALLGAIITLLFNTEIGRELAKYSVYYGIWNLIPFGNLDGAKVFFAFMDTERLYLGWYFITLFFYIIALSLVFIF